MRVPCGTSGPLRARQGRAAVTSAATRGLALILDAASLPRIVRRWRPTGAGRSRGCGRGAALDLWRRDAGGGGAGHHGREARRMPACGRAAGVAREEPKGEGKQRGCDASVPREPPRTAGRDGPRRRAPGGARGGGAPASAGPPDRISRGGVDGQVSSVRCPAPGVTRAWCSVRSADDVGGVAHDGGVHVAAHGFVKLSPWSIRRASGRTTQARFQPERAPCISVGRRDAPGRGRYCARNSRPERCGDNPVPVGVAATRLAVPPQSSGHPESNQVSKPGPVSSTGRAP